MTPRTRLLGLVVAATLTAQPGFSQTAPSSPVDPSTGEAPVAVQPNAPPAGSGEFAKGTAIGVVAGLVVLILIFSSGSSD